MQTTVERGQWGSRLGFVLAAVGSAVGLGNMWRFPYLTAEAGGAAFVFLYIVMVVLVGLPILLAEFSVGRGSKRSPIQALEHFGGASWRPLGYLFVIAGFVILSYYGVIAGWVIRYTVDYLFAGGIAEAGSTFTAYHTSAWAVVLHLLFISVAVVIVMGGVQAGIERASLILMPILFIIVAVLAIYAAFLEGAAGGYSFYLAVDFSELLSFEVFSMAAGQAFFSLSLGMGAMLTYSSYLRKDENLPRESITIAGTDFLVAFVAGLMIFPLIFALGLVGDVGESTVGALFITLPEAFAALGGAGQIVGFLFFSALLVGALTSAISLLEVVTSSAIDSLNWPRKKAAVLAGGAAALLGVPSAINIDILTLFDEIAGQVLLVLGALLISIFVGWLMPGAEEEVSRGASPGPWVQGWRFLLRYVAPVLLAIVLVYQLISSYQEIVGLF